jgi:RecA-family ATPase
VRETFPFGDEKAERAIAERVRLISLRDMAGDISFAGTDQSGAWVASRVENVVIEALRDVKDIRCVAFDTARQYAGGTTNDDRVMTIMTKAVTRVADELRCACLVTHHMTKEGARAGIADQYSGSGSGAFGDNLRFLLNLVPATFEDVSKALHLSDDDLRTLPRQQLLKVVDARGSLVRRALPDIYIARKGSQFRRIVADRKTEEERNKERVLEMLRAVEGGADTATRVGSSLKRSKTDALALVRECIDEGLIRRLRGERSPLMLTEAGKSKLAESGGESQ